jgi:predicted flap endonuclease-1-like 5' DNA nuclease
MFRQWRNRIVFIALLALIWWWVRRPQKGVFPQPAKGVSKAPGRPVQHPGSGDFRRPAPEAQTKTVTPVPISPGLQPTASPTLPTAPLTPPIPRKKRARKEKVDDLTVIVGIGPKISSLLQEAGIHTYAQLAETTLEKLGEILGKRRMRLVKPETWAEQAQRLRDAGTSSPKPRSSKSQPR